MRDAEFWHNKWASNQIGFHLEDVNPLLTRFWSALAPKREETVLVPLCGKTEDLAWLANLVDILSLFVSKIDLVVETIKLFVVICVFCH